MRHELWPHRVCTADRASAPQGVSQVRGPLSWKPLREKLLLLGSVSGHGLRPAHLSRKPTRHRDLPGGGGRQAVPHGLPQPGGTLDAGRCQRIARLAHLRRLCADSDCDCAPALCSRCHGRRFGRELVCLGFDDHRFVLGAVSVGPIPAAQGGGQNAHAAGSARQYSGLRSHH